MYESLKAFYDEDPRRHRSPEADYGVHWTNGAAWPMWRVSYVQATGEVYAAELGSPGRIEVLGTVPPDKDDIYYRTLDGLLEGWADESGRPLSWVRERIA